MSEAKIHHYVPQGYLKFFAKQSRLKNGVKYWVSVYDKQNHHQYPSNISHVAAEKNYNKIDLSQFVQAPPENDPLYYEKIYTDLIEGQLPQIIRNIIAASTLSTSTTKILNPDIKERLASLIVIQSLRSPNVRNYLGEIGRQSYNEIVTSVQDIIERIPEREQRVKCQNQLDKISYTDEFIKSGHLFCATDLNRISRYQKVLLDDHVWVIYENELALQYPYITSDVPVIFSNLLDNSVGFGQNGIAQPTTVISMPLTPRYLVALYHKKSIWAQCSDRFRDRCIRLDENEKKFIMRVNHLQFENCWRQIYAYPGTDLSAYRGLS